MAECAVNAAHRWPNQTVETTQPNADTVFFPG